MLIKWIRQRKVWKFGDNIDTDVIIPGRYLRTFNPEDLAWHVMAGEREDFASEVESEILSWLMIILAVDLQENKQSQ